MNDNATVTLEAEAVKTYTVTIPLGEKLAEKSTPVDCGPNPTVTNTNSGGNSDHDTDD